MTDELKPAPMRKIDHDLMRKEFAEIEARNAVLMQDGQRLMARIRPSSKYYGQGEDDALFPVCIGFAGDYCVIGGPGGQYRLRDVDLFAVFDDRKPPTQITFELSAG
ncbi:hypothetical protein [Acidovorax carolinensis]|nr:hypothetical protein [Acidovorax carolinensis]